MLMRAEDRGAGRGDVVLRGLRVGLHTGMAVLLLIGLVRLFDAEPDQLRRVAGTLVAGIFAAIYLAGTLAEKRDADRGAGLGSGASPAAPGRVQRLVWLALVTFLWAVLLMISADFTWLAFPLFFLHFHLLRPLLGVGAVAVLTAAVVLVQWAQPGGDHPATAIGPVIGAVFSVLMAQAYRVLHRENRALREAMEDLRRTREELAAAQHAAGALSERERLAREIHDTLAQGFSSIVLMSRAAVSSLDSEASEQAREQMDVVRRTAAENLGEARRFVAALQSGEERDPGLLEELRRVCQQIEAQGAAQGADLRCRLQIEGQPRALAGGQALVVLRAVQASLGNVLTHARARAVTVTLTFLEEELLVDIVDDGIGFDPQTVLGDSAPREDGTGVGLAVLRDRVTSQAGEMTVESAPGEGAAVSIRLPLAAAADPIRAATAPGSATAPGPATAPSSVTASRLEGER